MTSLAANVALIQHRRDFILSKFQNGGLVDFPPKWYTVRHTEVDHYGVVLEIRKDVDRAVPAASGSRSYCSFFCCANDTCFSKLFRRECSRGYLHNAKEHLVTAHSLFCDWAMQASTTPGGCSHSMVGWSSDSVATDATVSSPFVAQAAVMATVAAGSSSSVAQAAGIHPESQGAQEKTDESTADLADYVQDVVMRGLKERWGKKTEATGKCLQRHNEGMCGVPG
jgi:hypothetical protein